MAAKDCEQEKQPQLPSQLVPHSFTDMAIALSVIYLIFDPLVLTLSIPTTILAAIVSWRGKSGVEKYHHLDFHVHTFLYDQASP